MLRVALLSGGLAGLAGVVRSRRAQGLSHARPVAGLWLQRHRRGDAGPASSAGRGGGCDSSSPASSSAPTRMSRAVAVPTYIADVIVAASLSVHAGRHAPTLRYRPPVGLMPAFSTCSSRRRSGPPRFASRRRSSSARWGSCSASAPGVLNLGIEGIMTLGAMAGWMAVYQGADLWTGVLVAAARGRLLRTAACPADRAAGPVAARRRDRRHAARRPRSPITSTG